MIKGDFFNGTTSAKTSADLSYDSNGYITFDTVSIDVLNFSQLNISSRLGNTPRYIRFPDGALFETSDNDAVDNMVKALSDKSWNGLAHKLESAKYFVIAMVASVVLFAWLFIQYGIPYFSEEIANALPEEASQYMGQGVLEVMDESWFEVSKLSAKRQQALRKVFKNLLKNIENSENYKLEFRLGGEIKANAFALPNGTIVFTDELIELTETDLEVAAIMLHEIGHLQHHHSLRSSIQQFSLAMFAMLITGDVSASSSIISAIPLMLVESGFSQNMEIEADDFSFNYMQRHKIKTRHFATIMEKLEASNSEKYLECKKKESALKCIKQAVSENKDNTSSAVLNYFSTHPVSEDRINRFLTN